MNQETLFNSEIYSKAPGVIEWELENQDCYDDPHSLTSNKGVIEQEGSVDNPPDESYSITASNKDLASVTATVIEQEGANIPPPPLMFTIQGVSGVTSTIVSHGRKRGKLNIVISRAVVFIR